MNGLQQIAKRLMGVTMRRSAIVLGVWGEPGIGKTHAALALLRGTPCQSLRVHSTQALEVIVPQVPRPKKIPVWLERSLERLARGEPFETGAFVQTFAALLMANAPLILHVEDLHEATLDRLEVWQKLALVITRTRGVGLIATSRTQPPDGFEVIRLEPLNRAASDALLEAEAGAVLPVEALAWIFKLAHGNPLFTLEFFRFLARQGFVWNDGRHWRWREPERRLMPNTVEALIEQQLLKVNSTESVRRTLEVKALLPVGSPIAVLALVAELGESEIEAALGLLAQQGILIGMEFAHPLFREVRLATLRPERWRDLARRALSAFEHDPIQAADFLEAAALSNDQSLALLRAAALRAKEMADPAIMGRLLARAADHASGEEQYQVALEAAQVLKRLDFVTAIRLGEQALRLKPHDTQTIDLLCDIFAFRNERDRLEWVLAQLPEEEQGPKGLPRQVRLYSRLYDDEHVLELVQQNPALKEGNPTTVIEIAWSLLGLGLRSEVEVLIAQTLNRDDLSDTNRASFNYLQGMVFSQYGGDDTAAEVFFQKALLGYRRLGNSVNTIAGLHAHAIVLQNIGRYQEALPELEEAAQLCIQLGSITRLAETNLAIADQLQWFGQYEKAEHLYSENLEILRQYKDTDYLLDCLRSLAELYWSWDVPYGSALALKHASEALSLARVTGNPNRMLKALRALVMACVLNRQPVRALECADEALRLATANGQPNQMRNAHHARALALSVSGQKDEALQSARESLRWAEQTGDPYSIRLIGLEVARLTDNVALAHEYLDWFEEHGLINGVHIARRYFPEITPLTSGGPKPETSSRLEVLGPMQMLIAGKPEPVRGGKRKELLAALLEARIMGRSEVSRLDLFDALYPDTSEVQASAALSSLVYQLREQFGSDTILSSDGGYALGGITSDAEVFLETSDTRLWRGEYLESSDLGVGETVRETLHLALRHRAESLLETDPIEAVRVGRLLCSADPYDLESLRLTLRALRVSDNHKSLKSIYVRARTGLLEIGEVLPEHWTDFLETPTGKTA
jgi:tetratricopeptide (TPR) repeat protein